jgi:hypothetical protein
MRAVVVETDGAPEGMVIRDVPVPTAGPTELLIKIQVRPSPQPVLESCTMFVYGSGTGIDNGMPRNNSPHSHSNRPPRSIVQTPCRGKGRTTHRRVRMCDEYVERENHCTPRTCSAQQPLASRTWVNPVQYRTLCLGEIDRRSWSASSVRSLIAARHYSPVGGGTFGVLISHLFLSTYIPFLDLLGVTSILGLEAAGVIETVGTECTLGYKKGDRVMVLLAGLVVGCANLSASYLDVRMRTDPPHPPSHRPIISVVSTTQRWVL